MQQPVFTYDYIRGIIILLVFVAGIIWVMARTLKRSEDAVSLIVKWVATLLLVGFMVVKAAPAMDRGGFDAIYGLSLTLICGLGLTITWRHSIASMVAKPFGSLYDGGDQQIEAQAYYSIAEAKRKRGYYDEAVTEIRKQLRRFPTDARGQFLLAEIQAENLNDLAGAETTLHRFCEQPGHEPRNVAFALNLLADFQLKYGLDPDAARESLERITQLFPGTDLAISASQRIAHLSTRERLLEPHDRPLIHVPEGIKNMGLLHSAPPLAPRETDPETRAEELVAHLKNHPLDAEAREHLAIIYADHYDRLDLATDQLGQLIDLPNQPSKSVAHWLNLMADIQVRHGADYETVRDTLQRIIDSYPNQAAAALAQTRLNTLKLEFKAREKNQDVKLGTYEKYIGLTQGLPRRS